MTDIHTIWLLLGIGYFLGLVIIAYFGIVGTNEIIDFKNRQYKQEQIIERRKNGLWKNDKTNTRCTT